MPSIYQLKPAFQNLLRPCVRYMFHKGVSANGITLVTAAGSLMIGALVAMFSTHSSIFILIPIWMLVRMALNAIDGMLARDFGQQSNLGAYLNELCDVIADCALILPFLLIPDVSLMLVLLATLLGLLSEYAGVMGPMVGASRRYDGPMGKSDRAFAFSLMATGIALGWVGATGINMGIGLIGALLLYTLINRVRHGLNEIKDTPRSA